MLAGAPCQARHDSEALAALRVGSCLCLDQCHSLLYLLLDVAVWTPWMALTAASYWTRGLL